MYIYGEPTSTSIETNIRRIITTFTCGWCSAQVGYDIASVDYSTHGDYGLFPATMGQAFAVLKCRSCGMLNLLSFAVDEDDVIIVEEQTLEFFLADHPDIIFTEQSYSTYESGERFQVNALVPNTRLRLLGQYPAVSGLPDSVPEKIRRDIGEARSCLAVNATCAAAVMCRRAVEACAKTLGVDIGASRSLNSILTKLRAGNHIDDALYSALLEVKNWGNIGAHADDEYDLSHSDVQKVLQLTIKAIEYALSDHQGVLRDSTTELNSRRSP